jgi:hypothetical protein
MPAEFDPIRQVIQAAEEAQAAAIKAIDAANEAKIAARKAMDALKALE